MLATAVVGGLATDPASSWYRAVRKPPWQPPPPAAGLVWTPLYADLAVTAARTLDGLEDAGRMAERSAVAIARRN